MLGRFMVHCQRQHHVLLTFDFFIFRCLSENLLSPPDVHYLLFLRFLLKNFLYFFTLRISNTKSFELRLVESFWKVGQMLLLLVFFGKNEMSSPF